MATTISCNKCGNIIEVSEALTAELESKIRQETLSKHQAEISELIEKQKQLEQDQKNAIAKAKEQALAEARTEAIQQVRTEYLAKIETSKAESDAQATQNKALNEQIIELMKELRAAKDAESRLNVEFQKRLLEEENNIKLKARREAEDELSLKIAQKDKLAADLQKQLEEMKRRVEQGSQQLQGELLELALEDELRNMFMSDRIDEVPKGINGADVLQTVCTNNGSECGLIVWESKNTKQWSSQWIPKLKEDTRKLKGDVSILVSAILPENITTFGYVDGVLVCDIHSVIPLAMVMRERLIALKSSREANEGRSSKAEIVYNYLISNEFRQRIEVWIEYFKSRKEELDKEKAYFMSKWEKEDKNIMKVLQNTAGMYGDLQGLIGTALPKVTYLELTESN